MSPQFTLKDAGRENRILRNRLIVSVVAILVMLGLLVARLATLQIHKHDHFITLSQENRVKILPIPPTRGIIYSRDGVVLAENRPSFSLEVVPEGVADLEQTLIELSRIIEITETDILRFRQALRQKRRFENVPLRFNLTEEEVARFAIDRHRFPGVDISAQLTRHYPHGEATAHLLGYVGRIDENDLRSIDRSNYAGTSHIGKLGVERAYEDDLHGQVGYQQVEINAQGRILRVLERTPPRPGRDLHLTVDLALQYAAIEALGDRRGAVVAIDPRNGDVLALVSNPGYDPNPFVNGIDVQSYQDLRKSPERPLFNRALQATYPPGSTVKPFLGLIALELGVRTPDQPSWCPGWYSLPGHSHRYRDWKRTGHGRVNLERGIVESCDVYFYQLAQDLGIDRMHQGMTKFGFGRRTRIDLPGEAEGLMPSREWKRRVRNLPWYPGETLITGIGQGFMLATPLQLAYATALVSNRGVAVVPRVVQGIEDPGDQQVRTLEPRRETIFDDVRDAHWEYVVDSMELVVHGATGTARRTGLEAAYRFAGKTGTSQLFQVRQDQDARKLEIPEHLQDHALFVAFAPADRPEIALAIIVENGGSGSAAAAPIARTLFDRFLDQAPLPRVTEAGSG